ncbi:hypothetical protein Pmani_012050 [Petrolisthes manimaculis]|uniref:V-SNARE coiled-coil homology domain-containing protein n=1 Tax=Petrolisthes manimaculis TaxID=1843537 RepID=A0AAE1Q181_9EUCA|nr:hypothetical protein Pmani_012050 [Petrolisthes manimaculis]
MHPESSQQSPQQDPAQVASKNKLDETQQQVNDVVGIMRTNVERIMEREEKLNELDQRASVLSESSAEFKTTSQKLKRKYWWKNLKMMLILGAVVVSVIVIIVVSIVASDNGGNDGGGGGQGPTDTPLALPHHPDQQALPQQQQHAPEQLLGAGLSRDAREILKKLMKVEVV